MKLFRQRLLQAPDKPLVVMNMIELEARRIRGSASVRRSPAPG
ncbi:hypothetical protein SAMN04488548_13838 [Gordonia westfalica]|uniref:Uncharacterized protein n=1 Tax=Gordonia westfalica TaxID=158898 RepID=A0A1H2M4X3_9ACTN|nr:hypothetical protein SAMN04488548_13838 [Gordonia westfalica]